MSSNPNDTYDYLFKIIIIGDSGVGKSSLLTRYTRNEFSHESKTTIGVELATSVLDVDDKKIKMAIWDTAGQERFRAATNLYYRNTLGAFLVFDITNNYSFQNIHKWHTELKEHVAGNMIVTLIGNKCDLRHLRAVAKDDALELAHKLKMNYIETSALDSVNIETAFKNIVHDIYNTIYKPRASIIETNFNLSALTPRNTNITIDDSTSKPKTVECCKVN